MAKRKFFLDEEYRLDALSVVPNSDYSKLIFVDNVERIPTYYKYNININGESATNTKYCIFKKSDDKEIVFVYIPDGIDITKLRLVKSAKFIKKISKNIIKIVF